MPISNHDSADIIDRAVQPKPTVILTDEQNNALAEIEAWVRGSRQTYTLFGWAGTGKTTVLSQFIRDNPDAAVCALTGKAASVLRRKTAMDATTVHGLIYKLVEVIEAKGEPPKLRFTQRYKPGELAGAVIVLDECSMISERMAEDILATGARVIACGDPGQLPPVYGKRFFDTPDFTLQHIHRQALESPVIRQAHRVRSGQDYSSDGDAVRVITEVTNQNLVDADVILVWRHITRKAFNIRMREIGHLSGWPKAGEPVLCLQNVHSCGLFNGGVYTLAEDFRPRAEAISLIVEGIVINVDYVLFEGEEPPKQRTDKWGNPRKFTSRFDFGYALTVHKTQGSEWPNVLLIDDCRVRQHVREWRYTAITRAQVGITIARWC